MGVFLVYLLKTIVTVKQINKGVCMLFCSTRVSSTDAAELVVRLAGDKFIVLFNGNEFIFDPTLVCFSPDIATLLCGVNNTLALQWESVAINDKCGFMSAVARKRAATSMNGLISFFITSSGEVHAFTRLAVYVEGVDVIQVDTISRAEDAFAQHIPEAKDYAKRAAAKRKLLAGINTNDSLAILEAQLDLLTHIVLGDSKADEAKARLFEAFNGNSVSDVHTLEKMSETIKRQKHHIRAKQREYFAGRGVLKNADLSS